MFNEDKGFKLFRDDVIIGYVRVLRPGQRGGKRPVGYLALFIDKSLRSDIETQEILLTELRYVAKLLKYRYKMMFHFVLPFMPAVDLSAMNFDLGAGKQFGSTARERSSSVLLDEATGKPLY